jgi:toxin ParE1/3/4
LVKWSEPAKKSLQQIYYYIALDSEYYAHIVIDKLIATSEKLHDFPHLGRIVPEMSNENIRELFVYSYRLMYEIMDDDIIIIAIVHGKQNFPDNPDV